MTVYLMVNGKYKTDDWSAVTVSVCDEFLNEIEFDELPEKDAIKLDKLCEKYTHKIEKIINSTGVWAKECSPGYLRFEFEDRDLEEKYKHLLNEIDLFSMEI